MKYSIMSNCFLTDGLLEDPPHYSPIKKLVFINRSSSGISQIGVLDEIGMVSVWSINEIAGHIALDHDLNINLGGKFKLNLNYSDNLFDYENVINKEDMTDLT